MKYIKEYLGFSGEDENVSTLVDILEDSELDFQHSLCLVQTNKHCRYLIYGDKLHSIFYNPPGMIVTKKFELVRIQISLGNSSNKNSLISDIEKIDDKISKRATLSQLEIVKNNPILKRIQNLSEFVLINLEWIVESNPNREILVLDFTHTNNILN